MLQQLDVATFKAINGLGLVLLDPFFVLVSSKAFGLGAGLAVAIYFGFRRRWGAIPIILGCSLAFVVSDAIGSQLLKPLFSRIRPCYTLRPEEFRQLVTVSSHLSMPSLHSANSLAVALAAFLFERRTGWVLFPVAFLIAFSRIWVGVHWPTDLLGGWFWGSCAAFTGFATATLGQKAWVRFRSSRSAKEPELPVE